MIKSLAVIITVSYFIGMSKQHPLVTWRKKCGRTQAALARELGLGQGYLSMIETGQREPSLAVALRIKKITGLPVEKFKLPEAA